LSHWSLTCFTPRGAGQIQCPASVSGGRCPAACPGALLRGLVEHRRLPQYLGIRYGKSEARCTISELRLTTKAPHSCGGPPVNGRPRHPSRLQTPRAPLVTSSKRRSNKRPNAAPSRASTKGKTGAAAETDAAASAERPSSLCCSTPDPGRTAAAGTGASARRQDRGASTCSPELSAHPSKAFR
jgi:hypothetical protein